MVRIVVDWVLIPAAAIVTGVAVWVFVILWHEPHPIRSYHRTFWPETVRAGETINISEVVRAMPGCSSRVHRQWVNEISVAMAPDEFQDVPALPAGGETFSAKLTVPMVPPGEITLRTSVNFRCNFVQRLIGGTELPLPDLKITVIP